MSQQVRFQYDQQVLSQPQAVQAVLDRPAPPRLDLSRPVIFAGLGTSLHACRVAAAWLCERSPARALALDAHELALRLPLHAADQLVVVTHGGIGGFPGAALAKARAAGARTVAVIGEGVPEPAADLVLRTCPQESAGTHTVSYLTALTALGRLVGVDLAGVPELLRRALAEPVPVEAARKLAGRTALLAAGFGLDAITASEAALKLKEATFAWAEGTSVELALHGPPAALRAGMGALIFSPARDDAGRTARLRALCAALQVEAVSCGTEGEDLRFPACAEELRPLVSAIPVQRLAAEIARLAGGNPDTIHRDQEPWKSAMARL